MTIADPTAESGLFPVDAPPPVRLADRYTVPPFSVFDRRQGEWQDRRRRWLSLGIASELGRPTNLLDLGEGGCVQTINGGTSVFDPVLCEIVYRWYARTGCTVLDPFAGGSVRGIVAGVLERDYIGIDLRIEQVEENRAQLAALRPGWRPTTAPQWRVGDATNLDGALAWDEEFDLVFSCPPYADLEVYSDHPRDISTWPYAEFLAGHTKAIRDAVGRLRRHRYAVWVIGDVRDAETGYYRGLPQATIAAFEAAGCGLLNECVIVDPAGTAPIRAARYHNSGRKTVRLHQVLYVFVKGDARRAADWAEGRA